VNDCLDSATQRRMEEFAQRAGQSVIDLWDFIPWSPLLQEQILGEPRKAQFCFSERVSHV